MKLLLSAPAIAKLIEIDPDGTVELAKGAASQVAEEISRRVTRAAILNRITTFLDADMLEGRWVEKQINARYARLIGATMTAMAAPFVDALTTGKIGSQIREQVEREIAAALPSIDKALTERADAILRQRFAAMFGVEAGGE